VRVRRYVLFNVVSPFFPSISCKFSNILFPSVFHVLHLWQERIFCYSLLLTHTPLLTQLTLLLFYHLVLSSSQFNLSPLAQQWAMFQISTKTHMHRHRLLPFNLNPVKGEREIPSHCVIAKREMRWWQCTDSWGEAKNYIFHSFECSFLCHGYSHGIIWRESSRPE